MGGARGGEGGEGGAEGGRVGAAVSRELLACPSWRWEAMWRDEPERATKGSRCCATHSSATCGPDPAAARTALDAPILPMSPTTPPSTEYAM